MKKRRPLFLQKRDIELIELSCDLGYLTTRLVTKLGAFPSLRVARRRLQLLHENGYLGIYRRTLEGCSENLYYPIFSGIQNIINKCLLLRAEKVCHFRPWAHANTRHEDILRDWAVQIKRSLPMAEIDLDFMLYNNQDLGESIPNYIRSHLPDMVVRLDEGMSINIEIELTLKSNDRYLQRLRKLMATNARPTVYLTDLPAIKDKVQKIRDSVEDELTSKGTKIKSEVSAFLFNELKGSTSIGAVLSEIGAKALHRQPYPGGTLDGTRNLFEERPKVAL